MKRLGFFDVLLSVVSVVLTCEAIAPAARIGASSIFWWVVLLFGFLFPYAKVVLGFCEEYGYNSTMYVWVARGLGRKQAGRVSWYYWVNYVTWFASVVVLFASTTNMLIGYKLHAIGELIVSILFILVVFIVGSTGAANSKKLMNIGAIAKILIATVLGVVGLFLGIKNGFAIPVTPRAIFSDIGSPQALSHLSIILFNFMGLEVIASYGDRMEDPKRDLPKAFVLGGICICLVYLLSSLGVMAQVNPDDIASDTGIMDAARVMFNNNRILVSIVGIAFILSLFTNMVSWAMGVCSEIRGAALNRTLPSVFAIGNYNGEPVGAMLVSAVTIICIVSLKAFIVNSSSFFEIVFSLNVVFALLSYIPLFPCYFKLQNQLAQTTHQCLVLKLTVALPTVELIVACICSLYPVHNGVWDMKKVSLLVASLIVLAVGEILEYHYCKSEKPLVYKWFEEHKKTYIDNQLKTNCPRNAF